MISANCGYLGIAVAIAFGVAQVLAAMECRLTAATPLAIGAVPGGPVVARIGTEPLPGSAGRLVFALIIVGEIAQSGACRDALREYVSQALTKCFPVRDADLSNLRQCLNGRHVT